MNPNLLKPGLVSVTFRALAPEQIIDLSRRAKLEAIEWGGDVHVPHGDLARAREVGRMTRDDGLQIAAYGSYYRAGASEVEETAFESVVETARELGAPTIRVWAGAKGSNEYSNGDRAQVIEDLQRITALAAQAGLTISLEYHANTLTDTIESARALLDAIPAPNLKTLWQPPHEQSLEHCLSSLRSVLDRLGNVHVFHWQIKPRQRLALNEGEPRWRAYLDILRNDLRARYLLLEFMKADSAEQLIEDAATLRKWISKYFAARFNPFSTR